MENVYIGVPPQECIESMYILFLKCHVQNLNVEILIKLVVLLKLLDHTQTFHKCYWCPFCSKLLILLGENSQAERHLVFGFSASKAERIYSMTTVCLGLVKTLPSCAKQCACFGFAMIMTIVMMMMMQRVVLAATPHPIFAISFTHTNSD